MTKGQQLTENLMYLIDTWYDLTGSEFEFE